VLGVEPASVERPNSPADLTLALLNSTNMLSTLPEDFALEFCPYWLTNHPTLEWRKDQNLRDIPSSIQQTLTVSSATAQIGNEIAPVTGLGVGIRTQILSGWLSNEMVAELTKAEVNLKNQSLMLDQMVKDLRGPIDKKLTDAITAADGNDQAIDLATREHERSIRELTLAVMGSSEYKDRISKLKNELSGLTTSRVGPFLELAVASSWQFPNHQWDNANYNRYGIWLGFSWVADELSIATVLRYTGDGQHAVNDAVDYGGRLFYTSKNFAISGEVVGRGFINNEGADANTRWAGIIDYEIRDDVWVTGTFGRDFGDASSAKLLAKLGLSFNVSSSRTVLPSP
jgi:hypothetical protein